MRREPSPKYLLMVELIVAPKKQNRYYFYLSPFVPLSISWRGGMGVRLSIS
jgi:hypothetical protein